MAARGHELSATTKARISESGRRTRARRREREALWAKIEPLDIREVRAGRCKHPLLIPLAVHGTEQLAALYADLGGFDQLSTARRSIGADWSRLGLILGSELERYAQTRDAECVPRITTLVSARRACLASLGLDRVARDVPRLDEYVASQGGAGATFDVQPEVEVTSDV